MWISGVVVLDPADDVHVIVERQLVVQAADDVQLGRPALVRLPRPLHDLIVVHHIGASFAQVGPERAEVARVDADIRRVDVRVDVVVAEIAVVPLADQVGHRAEREQVVRRLQCEPILEAQTLARLDLFAKSRPIASDRLDITYPSFRRYLAPLFCDDPGNQHGAITLMLDLVVSVILVRIEPIINRDRLWPRNTPRCTIENRHQFRSLRMAGRLTARFRDWYHAVDLTSH